MDATLPDMPGPRHRRLRVGWMAGDGHELGRRYLFATQLLRRRYPSWEFLPTSADQAGADFLGATGIDALICRSGAVEPALRLSVPMVVIGSGPARFPSVGNDEVETGRLAAQHLIGRGYRRLVLAHFGTHGSVWMGRARGFREAAGPKFVGEWTGHDGVQFTAQLRTAPEGTGVFAVNDLLAARIAVQAHRLALDMPGHLGLIGVDDDDLHSQVMSPVPLSSIAQDVESILLRACAALDGHLDAARPRHLAIAPLAVRVRASTDVQGGAELLPRALDLIRRHACHGLTVVELASRLGVQVRTLHRGFRRAQGRGPLEVIREVRVGEAERLLRTGATVAQTARQVGFAGARGLVLAFHEFRGMSPAQWREADHMRGRAASGRPRSA